MCKPQNRQYRFPPREGHFPAAFSLIELLVVLAIITILASLLLPGLSRARAAGHSASCKSNLREIGIALQLYTGEYGAYPAAAGSDGGTSGTTFALWDGQLLPFAANNRNLFVCPANQQAPPWTNNLSWPQPNSSYGYNIAGTGRYPTRGPSLGLDGGYDAWSGTATFVRERQVRVPSDLVAVMDVKPLSGGGDNDLDDLFPINLLAELSPPRHNQGANAVFCDSHVEYAKLARWLQKSDTARQRWNIDHQPHSETWPNNP